MGWLIAQPRSRKVQWLLQSWRSYSRPWIMALRCSWAAGLAAASELSLRGETGAKVTSKGFYCCVGGAKRGLRCARLGSGRSKCMLQWIELRSGRSESWSGRARWRDGLLWPSQGSTGHMSAPFGSQSSHLEWINNEPLLIRRMATNGEGEGRCSLCKNGRHGPG